MKTKNKTYIEKYKSDLITAYFHKYVKNLPTSVLREMERIVEEETGKTMNTNFGCSACVLKLVKEMGRVYFTDYQDEIPEDLKDRFIPIKRDKNGKN